MRPEIEIIEFNLDYEDPDFSEKPTLKINELNRIINLELSEIEKESEVLRKRKKPLMILLNKIKPYIKQNKLRGSELLKAKGIEK